MFTISVALTIRLIYRDLWLLFLLLLDWRFRAVKGQATHISFRGCSWDSTVDGTRTLEWKK